jgi:hypothetical protein
VDILQFSNNNLYRAGIWDVEDYRIPFAYSNGKGEVKLETAVAVENFLLLVSAVLFCTRNWSI